MNEHKPLQDNYKKKQRKAVLRLVALLLVTATLISTAAWSWFTDNQEEVTASGLQIVMEAQKSKLEISIDGGKTWSNSIDLLDGTDILERLDMVPLTGQGFLHGGEVYLYMPELEYSNDGKASVLTSEEWENQDKYANVHYISLEVMFRTEQEADVYIGKGTSVVTESEILIGDECGNPSLYGDFSRDAIVGALRMSLAVGSEDNLSFIWIPRPDVKLVDLGAGDYELLKVKIDDPWGGIHDYFTKEGIKTSAIRYNCPQSSEAFLATDGSCDSANSLTRAGSTAFDTKKFDPEYFDPKYAYCTAYIKLWVDGEDAEASRALSRGRFRVQINFVVD